MALDKLSRLQKQYERRGQQIPASPSISSLASLAPITEDTESARDTGAEQVVQVTQTGQTAQTAESASPFDLFFHTPSPSADAAFCLFKAFVIAETEVTNGAPRHDPKQLDALMNPSEHEKQIVMTVMEKMRKVFAVPMKIPWDAIGASDEPYQPWEGEWVGPTFKELGVEYAGEVDEFWSGMRAILDISLAGYGMANAMTIPDGSDSRNKTCRVCKIAFNNGQAFDLEFTHVVGKPKLIAKTRTQHETTTMLIDLMRVDTNYISRSFAAIAGVASKQDVSESAGSAGSVGHAASEA